MRILVKIEKILLGCAMLFATIIIFYAVISRRLGAAPQWGEEATRYLMIWITFIGSALCFRREAHFGIDVIKRIPNKNFQRIVTIFVWISCLAFAGMLFVFGYQYTKFTFISQQKTAALGWPIWLVYLSVPVGSGLSIIHLVEVFWSRILGHYTIDE